jgi:hypothetical protein
MLTMSTLRDRTEKQMTCGCGAPRYLTASGAVCSKGCGKVIPISQLVHTGSMLAACSESAFRDAWSDRVMEYGNGSEDAQGDEDGDGD